MAITDLFAIYYTDGSVVEGNTRQDWNGAPTDGVQVMVLRKSAMTQEQRDQFLPLVFPIDGRFVNGIVGCNRLKPNVVFYTGVDEYSLQDFGLGGQKKNGELIPDAEYQAIWDRAYADH